MKKLAALSLLAALTLPVAAHAEMKYDAPSQDFYPATIPTAEGSVGITAASSSASTGSHMKAADDADETAKYVHLKDGTKIGIGEDGKAWADKKGVAVPLKDGKYTLKGGAKLVVKGGVIVK